MALGDTGDLVDCVIGSGPAGVACAAGLLAQGRPVIMLDAGIRLEPERDEIVRRLGSASPETWDARDVARIKEGTTPTLTGIPEKLLFGSDYPYRSVGEHHRLQTGGLRVQSSLAFGGLSTVWGAALMPYCDADIADWPIGAADLAPHYRAALRLTPLSGGADDLAGRFPLYCDTPGQLAMPRQAQYVWRKLTRHRDALANAGVQFGRARVAIRAAETGGQSGCVDCGLCMFGCPYGHIFSAAHVVESWKGRDGFRYQPGLVVERFEERGDHVLVRGHHLDSRAPFELRAARVLLAAGVVPTTAMLLRSMNALGRTVTIKDSQYFLFPALLARGVAHVRSEPGHALSQIFFEISDRAISRYTLHVQMYARSELMGRLIGHILGPLQRPLDFVARIIEGRLMMLQGFVHSDDSSAIEATLRMGEKGDVLDLRPVVNPQARRVVNRVARKLISLSPRLGFLSLIPGRELPRPGRGFHFGGSFPMRRSPGAFETDVIGRPTGWSRVHVVDASVFPSIAATTITLTAMANAHRIATEAAKLR